MPPDRTPFERRREDGRLSEIERKLDRMDGRFDTMAQIKTLEDRQTETWRKETREAIADIRMQLQALRGNGKWQSPGQMNGTDLLSKVNWQQLALAGGGIGYVIWEIFKR